MAHDDPAWRRWAEVNRVFAASLELPDEAAQEAFVLERCGADRELRDTVLSLLQAERESEGFLESADGATAHAALAELASRPAASGASGVDIGPYRVIRPLGRGGMGTVYLAERTGEDFVQRAAIKLLRRGVDTDDVVRRFLAERRILAGLVHPNIARLLDGGSTRDGRPYLAMEYVDGEPITEYCDARRLSVDRRLELFLRVTDAVAYAHTKLVVHRDLKPSNILVTAEGRVKLLDFGIAKILGGDGDDASVLTRTGWRVLTPEFASPEQLRGEPITTASDVFQLGMLLYVLLTGRRPFGARAGSRGAGAVDTVEPRRPSSSVSEPDAADVARLRATSPDRLRRRLRGDLDTIVLESLREEPERRYDSVGRMADDVRRHLEGLPVSARPATLTYRAGKFLRRHGWVAPTATAALLFAALYVGTSVRYTRRLEDERNAARQQAARAEEVQKFLTELFQSPDPFTPADPARGREITVVEALDIGADRVLAELGNRPRVQASLLDAIAGVYGSLGVTDHALDLARVALGLHATADGVGSPPYRTALAEVALLEETEGRADTALALYRRRLVLTLADPEATSAEEATAHGDLATALADPYVERLEEALQEFRQALAVNGSGSVPPDRLAAIHRGLANVLQTLDRQVAALPHARLALHYAEAAFGPASATAGMAHESLAKVLDSAGRRDEAGAEFQRAYDILKATLGPDDRNTLNARNNQALFRRRGGDLAGAEQELRELLSAYRRTGGGQDIEIADTYQNLGVVLRGLGRLDEAAAMHRRAGVLYGRILEPDNYMAAYPWLSLSAVELTMGKADSAEAHARRALTVLRRSLPPGHYARAVARCRLGLALLAEGRRDSALVLLRSASRAIRSTPMAKTYRQECEPPS